jgi:hypothetical protein
MQQRRLRLGDILDDYCPRERRITNHAVVAMIEDEVKQTRCTTCDADHEYKRAKIPSSRRKRPALPGPAGTAAQAEPLVDLTTDSAGVDLDATEEPAGALAASSELSSLEAQADEPGEQALEDEPRNEDDGPVHRRLIRATLPRPEGQAPERKAPDFTIRQPGGRFDQQRQGPKHRGRPTRQAHKTGGDQPARFGGPRHGSGSGSGQGQRHGNRLGNGSDNRGGRPHGQNRGGQRQGGHGRKRGR